jgi:alkylhydroperoxidase family enzyme
MQLTSALELKSGDPKTTAALAFAASVTRKHGSVSALEVQNLREVGYSDEEIVEIIALIALNIFRNYFNLIAGTDPDFPPVAAKPTLEMAESS